MATATATLVVRATREFADKVDELAHVTGMTRSDYLREAVEEKNARVLAERIAFLSQTLGQASQELNEEMEGALGDGLADR